MVDLVATDIGLAEVVDETLPVRLRSSASSHIPFAYPRALPGKASTLHPHLTLLSTEGFCPIYLSPLSSTITEVAKEIAMKRSSRILFAMLLFLYATPRIGRADDGPEHQIRRSRPIELAVSGSNVKDRSTSSCCGTGTLDSLVSKGGEFFVLSNHHVLARANRGTIGDDISGCITSSLGDTGVRAAGLSVDRFRKPDRRCRYPWRNATPASAWRSPRPTGPLSA